MKNLKISGFALFLLISSACFAQKPNNQQDKTQKSLEKSYESWDTNKNKKVDKKEFKSAFDKMDTFKLWDTNGDKFIDQEEWDKEIDARSEYMDDNKLGSFEDWDINDDKKISKTEYTDVSFKMWDKDNNGHIDSKEYMEHQKNK